jgi:hypothetical protein
MRWFRRFVLAGMTVCATAGVSPAQDATNIRTELLSGPDFRVRVSAALYLGKTKPPDARFLLERALDDAHPAVRASAAVALGQVGDAGAIPQLQKHLASEASGAVKSQIKAAIEALAPKNAPIVATLGNARYVVQLGNIDSSSIRVGKAGRSRWYGVRPTVRGVAMNPVDHPHGGGEGKTSGGRHPVSPWGQAEGRTRKANKSSDRLIVRRRRTNKKR